MNIHHMLKKIINKLRHRDNTMEYCYAHGFTSGKNFACHSPHAIDANWPWLISIGDNVTIAPNVKLLAHDASTAKIDGVHTKIGIITIGNIVFIGYGTVVLPNVRIGDNVIVGANSVVSHDIPSGSVFAGNPAKLICFFEEFSDKHQNNQDTHPLFHQHSWTDWINAPEEEKQEMRAKLENTFGYL